MKERAVQSSGWRLCVHFLHVCFIAYPDVCVCVCVLDMKLVIFHDVSVCIFTHMYVYMHMHIQTYINMHVHTVEEGSRGSWWNVRVHSLRMLYDKLPVILVERRNLLRTCCSHAGAYVCTHTHIHMFTYMYIYTHIPAYRLHTLLDIDIPSSWLTFSPHIRLWVCFSVNLACAWLSLSNDPHSSAYVYIHTHLENTWMYTYMHIFKIHERIQTHLHDVYT